MASAFRISEHRSSRSVHLRLSGDFDQRSAWELRRFLESRCRGVARIFIHTNDLKAIHSTDRDAFKQIFEAAYAEGRRLVFTGDHASRFLPAGTPGSQVISGNRPVLRQRTTVNADPSKRRPLRSW